MADETIEERFDLSADPVEAYNQALDILKEYRSKNPGRQPNKFEFYLLTEMSHYILLITSLAAGIH